jgi:hypothetical protein
LGNATQGVGLRFGNDLLETLAVFRSTQFRILAESVHRRSGQRCELEVLVDCAEHTPQIVQWKELP